jgi:hypothetical protein
LLGDQPSETIVSPGFLLGAILPHLKQWLRKYLHGCDDRRSLIERAFKGSGRRDASHFSASRRKRFSPTLEGYPVPMRVKKCACLVTYRHSSNQLFENASAPWPNVTNL